MPKFTLEKDGAGRWVATKVTDAAEEDARNIPDWATWTATEATDWIEVNVTDLASARTVLKAMARLLVALRNAQWPELND